ncbi:MAG: Gmad2 immunoglobulin-like domain-containing protein [Candidatus Paceibacterota bacterium]
MKRRHYLTLIVLLFALSMWGLVTTLNDSLSQHATPVQNTTAPEIPGQAVTPVVAEDVIITTPMDGSTISSPVTIKGKAKGTWFFEGSFPISLITVDGTTIATGIAKAEDDWMVESYVPFTATINFTSPATVHAGYIVLKKDNPSGEARFDKSVVIKVQW